jgi:hypothetical protein
MTHTLKIWPGSFEAVTEGRKRHEIRDCSDREFTKGDTVILREWVPTDATKEGVRDGRFTGRSLMRKISYISVPGSWGLPHDSNICVFTIE